MAAKSQLARRCTRGALARRRSDRKPALWNPRSGSANARIEGAVNQRLIGPAQEPSRSTIQFPAVCVASLARHKTDQELERNWTGARWRETSYVFTPRIGTPIDARNLLRNIMRSAGRRRNWDRWHSPCKLTPMSCPKCRGKLQARWTKFWRRPRLLPAPLARQPARSSTDRK